MTIEQRVAKLERRNPWRRRLTPAIVFVALIAACSGAAKRDTPRDTPVRDTRPPDPQVPDTPTPDAAPPDTPKRPKPHIDPGELERIAYKVVRAAGPAGGTPLSYVVYRSERDLRSLPKFYDLDGYRILLYRRYLGRDAVAYWEFELNRAERQKRTTIVADEFMRKHLLRANKVPPSYVESGKKLSSLQDFFYPEAALRRDYKQTCSETLSKILRLADEGDLAYLPLPLRAEIKKVIDSDDYHDLCRAMNAVIAFGIVAQAYEYERDHWSGNLDEPWSLLARRTREAIEHNKRAGGTVRVLARPQSFPHPPPVLW